MPWSVRDVTALPDYRLAVTPVAETREVAADVLFDLDAEGKVRAEFLRVPVRLGPGLDRPLQNGF
jgi:hypothetical protein